MKPQNYVSFRYQLNNDLENYQIYLLEEKLRRAEMRRIKQGNCSYDLVYGLETLKSKMREYELRMYQNNISEPYNSYIHVR